MMNKKDLNLHFKNRYDVEKSMMDDDYESIKAINNKYIALTKACNGDESCINKVKKEHQKILAEKLDEPRVSNKA